MQQYNATKEDIKNRLIAGEYVRVVDYERNHKRSQVLKMVRETMDYLISRGFVVMIICENNNQKDGWMLQKPLLHKLKAS